MRSEEMTMRIGPYTRLGPDLHTTWGTYPSPYITQPASAVLRPWLPPTIRGRHEYRVQPRALTVMPPDPVNRDGVLRDVANRARASLVPGNPGYGAEAATDPQTETKIGTYIFLGLVSAVVGYLAFGGPKRNPSRRAQWQRRRAALIGAKRRAIREKRRYAEVYGEKGYGWWWRARGTGEQGPYDTRKDAEAAARAAGFVPRHYPL